MGRSQEGRVKISLTIAAKEPYQLPPSVDFEGTSQTNQTKGAPIVTIVVGLVLVSFLVDLVLDVYNRITDGTIILDLRDKKVSIHNIPGASLELIVVTDTGVQHFARGDISRDVVNAFLTKALGRKL
jgi:hypothetical protein